MSRPGGKKRGVKSTGPGPHHAPGGEAKHPKKPFPRAYTVVVTPPGIRPGDSIRDANAAWFTWLRIISNLTQMTLPPGRRHEQR
jgi:hypothetical protein